MLGKVWLMRLLCRHLLVSLRNDYITLFWTVFYQYNSFLMLLLFLCWCFYLRFMLILELLCCHCFIVEALLAVCFFRLNKKIKLSSCTYHWPPGPSCGPWHSSPCHYPGPCELGPCFVYITEHCQMFKDAEIQICIDLLSLTSCRFTIFLLYSDKFGT